jgi:hypothetical protein
VVCYSTRSSVVTCSASRTPAGPATAAEPRCAPGSSTHPTVGRLTLHYEALLLPDDGDQLLTIYATEPGTRDAERLAQLSELAKATA